MGNILLTEQFQVGIKQFLQAKSTKKTLKIKYKEKQGIILAVEPPQIYVHDFQELPLLCKRWVRCQLRFDPNERKRYYKKCLICNTKISQFRQLETCGKCEQQTLCAYEYSMVFWLIDGDVKVQAIMFDVAEQFLGLTALKFKQMDLETQNKFLERINLVNEAKYFEVQIGPGKSMPVVYRLLENFIDLSQQLKSQLLNE